MSDLPLTNAGDISDSVVPASQAGRNLGGPGPFLSTAADARRREEWRDAFQDAEDLLDDFKSFYLDKTQSDLPESEINAAEQFLFDIPDASVFDYIDFKDGTELSYTDFIRKDISGPNGVGAPVERYVYNSQSVVGVLRSLYILIFKKDELTFQYVPKEPPHDGDAAPTFDGIFRRFSLGRFKRLIRDVAEELEARTDAFEEAIPVTAEEAAEIEGDLSNEDIDFIVENESFENMFSTTFDIETISLIPVLYNFYLTSEYFQDINKAFQNPKNTALGIILSTIANDGEYNASPVLSRPASRAATSNSTGQDQGSAFETAARDFILKMLIKTPIDILKGLVGLVDPHVALSKIIKQGTGFAFNAASMAIDQPAAAINTQIATATNDEITPNLNGSDLMTFILCIADNLIQNISNGEFPDPENPQQTLPSLPPNFFPRLSIDGVDFTGTVSGMLMTPPSPLGILYLLLELLTSEITNQTADASDAAAENANANECTPDPALDELTDPCEDTEGE
jgi:hypothetical protein